MVMVNSKDQLLDGMDVYDEDGEKVGKVVRYDVKLGYFETEGTFEGKRYIPFSAIERIGPTGAYLNVAKWMVSDIYKHLPKVTPGLAAKGTLTGGATIPNGLTGRPVPLDAAALNEVRGLIHAGSHVFDSDKKKLGKVQTYDSKTGYMRIEKGTISPKDIFLPVTSVAFLDEQGIHLSETKDRIANRFTRLPEVAREFFAT